ncbi:MAG: IclR family transcriptional regulator [Vicinamibacteraceae bacterium]
MRRALELLSCFSLEKPEWGVTEIADFLGVYKSTVHRFLKTFERAGFVHRTTDRRYQIGVRALELGITFRFTNRLIGAAELPLRLLAERTQSVAHLMQLDGRDTFELLRATGLRRTAFSARRIIRREAHATASGKVLLAYGGHDSFREFVGLRSLLKTYTPYTLDNPKRLLTQMRLIRDQRYALDDQESCPGVRCLAVAIEDDSGKAIAAISISNVRERFDDQHVRRLVPWLVSTAGSIGRGLRGVRGHTLKASLQG